MKTLIGSSDDLQVFLAPIDLSGQECLEYRLGSFQSRLTLELLQIRLRKQGQVFEVTDQIVPCIVHVSTKTLKTHLSETQKINERVSEGIFSDPVFQITLLRTLINGLSEVIRRSEAVENFLEKRETLPIAVFLSYIDVVTNYQAMDSLKFSLTLAKIRKSFEAFPEVNQALIEAVAQVTPTSIFTIFYQRQLELLLVYLANIPEAYAKARGLYRKEVGFLEAEDMDFVEYDNDDFVDEKMKRLGNQFQGDSSAVQKQLDEMTKASQHSISTQNSRLNEFLVFLQACPERLRVWNLLQLWVNLLKHQEMNRWVKMRCLRNLHDLCTLVNLSSRTVGLMDVLKEIHST